MIRLSAAFLLLLFAVGTVVEHATAQNRDASSRSVSSKQEGGPLGRADVEIFLPSIAAALKRVGCDNGLLPDDIKSMQRAIDLVSNTVREQSRPPELQLASTTSAQVAEWLSWVARRKDRICMSTFDREGMTAVKAEREAEVVTPEKKRPPSIVRIKPAPEKKPAPVARSAESAPKKGETKGSFEATLCKWRGIHVTMRCD